MGTRPKIKYKKVTKKQLKLSEKEQRTVALDMLSGIPIKQAVEKYKISRAYAHEIFHKFIRVELKWRFK